MSIVLGFSCNECGFVGAFDEFPSFPTYTEDEDGNVYKDSDTLCPKCESEDLEIIDDPEDYDIIRPYIIL